MASWAQIAKNAAHIPQPPPPLTDAQEMEIINDLRDVYERRLNSKKAHADKMEEHKKYLAVLSRREQTQNVQREITVVQYNLEREKIASLSYSPAKTHVVNDSPTYEEQIRRSLNGTRYIQYELPDEIIKEVRAAYQRTYFVCENHVIRLTFAPSDPYNGFVVVTCRFHELVGRKLRNIVRHQFTHSSREIKDMFDDVPMDTEQFHLQTDEQTIVCTTKIGYEWSNSVIMMLDIATI